MFCPNQIKFLKGKASGSPHSDLGGASGEWWNLSYGNTTSHWTYDYALADKIVGSGNHNKGCAWILKSDTVKKAFEQIGAPQTVAKYLRCEGISDPNKVGYKTLTYKTYSKVITTTAQAYNSLWFRDNKSGPGCQVTRSVAQDIMKRRPGVIDSSWNVYFRDIISFYRGVITSSSTQYGCVNVTAGSIKYNIEADYEGIAQKTVTQTSNEVVKWKAIVTYSGTISGTLNDWNGIVKYKGTVTKRNIIGNISPVGNDTLTMFPDDEGYLMEDMNNKQSMNIESELFRVTDMFKDGIPLFYSYRLKNKVYSNKKPNQFGLIDTDNIVLVDNLRKPLNDTYKYKVRYTESEIKDIYYVDIYTNFENNSGKNIYCLYIAYDENAINKVNSEVFEKIYVQPCFERGRDYINEEVHKISRKNKVKILNPGIIDDNRNKVRFEYIVDKIKDGEVVASSTPISTSAINYKYALDNEKHNFVGRSNIISPKGNVGFKTAKQLVDDNRGTEVNKFSRALISTDVLELTEEQKTMFGIAIAAACGVTIDSTLMGEDVGLNLYNYLSSYVVFNEWDEDSVSYLITKELKQKAWEFVSEVGIENRPFIKRLERKSIDHPLRVRDYDHNLLTVKFDPITATNMSMHFKIAGGDDYYDQSKMTYESKIHGLRFEVLKEINYSIRKDSANNNFELYSFGNFPNESMSFGKYTIKNPKLPYYLRFDKFNFYRNSIDNIVHLNNVRYEYDVFVNYSDLNSSSISKTQLHEELTDNCIITISNKLLDNLKYHITAKSILDLFPDVIIKRDNLPPIINGVKDRTIPYGMEFNPRTGVTAIDNEDGDLTSEIIIEGKVNEYIPGDYIIKYKVSDSKGLTATKKCTITVDREPNIKPVIYGVEDITILKDSEFDKMEGVTAYDREDGNITNNIIVEGRVDTNLSKEYVLTYKVSDSEGATTIKERIVTVSEYVAENEHVEDIIYNVRLTDDPINASIKNKVNLFTNPNGENVILAEVFEETGFPIVANGKTEYTGKLNTPGFYIIKNNKIRLSYAVKCIDVREISLKQPRNNKLLENWYPSVQFGHATRVFSYRGVKKKIIYDIPEFNDQLYGKYNRPYIDIKGEKAEYVNDRCIKTRFAPLFVALNDKKESQNLKAYIKYANGKIKNLTITNWLYNEGLIYVKEILSEYDSVYVDYTYEEHIYEYRGFYDEYGFKDLDLNLNKYHNFFDTSIVPYKDNKVYNLLNKTIYFFLKPAMIVEDFVTDNDQVEVSKVFKRMLTNKTNIFPDKITINAGMFNGDIFKSGTSYVIEGSSRPIETRLYKKEIIDTLDSLPDYYEIDEYGFKGYLPKKGNPVYVSGIDSPEESKTFNKVVIQDTQDFPLQYEVDEDGYLGFIDKDGECILISGPTEEEEYKDVEKIIKYKLGELILETIEYNDENYNGTLDMVHQERDIVDYEKINVTDVAYVTKRSQIYYKWYHGGQWVSSDCLLCEEKSKEIEYLINDDYILEINELKADGYEIVCNELKDINNLFDDTTLVGEEHERLVYRELREVTKLVKKDIVNDYDRPIFGGYIVTYTGTVTHNDIEDRRWQQSYRGILTKTLPDGRKFKQLYEGEITSTPYDDRVFAQDYMGALSGYQTSESGLDEIEIVYIIDNSIGINHIRKTLAGSMRKIHESLSDTGVSNIKYGIIEINSEEYRVKKFNEDVFTNDINKVIDETNNILNTSYFGESLLVQGIKGVFKNYNFESNSRHIIVVTNSVPGDLSEMYNTIELANSSDVNIHVATDTNEMHSKTLSVLSNETGGNVCEFVNSLWEDHLILAIARISLYGIVSMVNKDTLYHKIDDDIPNNKYDLLIGSIFLSHNSSLESTEIVDARVIGGGIKEEVSDSLRRELEIESDSYFDIGYFDGEAYPENSVIVIRLDKNILIKNGGKFSEKDVEHIVKRWIATGTLPIIEYVDVYDTKPINEGLKLEVEPINKINTKPSFICDVEEV